MKQKKYTYKDGGVVFLTSLHATDLFKTPVRRFGWIKGVKGLEPITYNLAKELGVTSDKGNTKRDARRKAGKIFCDFMEMLAKDMIDDHVIFVLPMPNGGYMYITDLNTINKPEKRFYNPRTKGTYYVPILHRGTRMSYARTGLYTIRFNQKWRNYLYNKIVQGERYSD